MATEETSYAQLTREVVHGSQEPLPVDEIYERVNALRPITTKNPKQTIRSAVGADAMIVNTGDGRYGWKTRVINGSKLSYTLRESDLLMEVLQYTDELFDALCPTYEAHELYRDLNPINVKLPDGTDTQFPLEDLYPGMWGTHAAEEFWEWLEGQKPNAGDQLIITIDNAEERQYSVTFQPRHQRDESAIAQRNQEFEALIRKLLDRPYGAAPWVITTHALARGCYQDDIPPDPLYEIWRSHIWSFIPQGVEIPTHPPVEIDPMLSALFERPAQVYDPENPPDVPREYDPNYGRRRPRKSNKAKTKNFTSYTFRVNHRALPEVWRDIELAEDQTMEDLHLAIQQAFGWNGYKVVFGGDTAPNVWYPKYAKGADLAIHECWMTSEHMMKKYNQPAQLALRINLMFHTSAQSFGQIMSMVQPRHAVAYHFFNDADTRYAIYNGVRETYDGPLSMATDMMVWNITRNGVTERMGVSTDDSWDVEGPSEKLAPDPNRASEYSQFILDGRLDVDEANARWVKEFMEQNGLTEKDLDAGGG